MQITDGEHARIQDRIYIKVPNRIESNRIKRSDQFNADFRLGRKMKMDCNYSKIHADHRELYTLPIFTRFPWVPLPVLTRVPSSAVATLCMALSRVPSYALAMRCPVLTTAGSAVSRASTSKMWPSRSSSPRGMLERVADSPARAADHR
eukprot:2655317-Rhodomonas_salina.1